MDAPSDAEIELEFYERFLIERGLEPYPVQEQAFARIFAGDNLLVTVPTGTGKTLMAKAGIYRALRSGRTAIYTTPLRALTEEKFRELCDDFGESNVGFATGDYKVNPEAPIQVLVAEILWNRIYGDRVNVPADVVIMDEGHYFNDPERGHVWEQSVIGLDPRTQLVVLSATVGNPEAFCQWAYVTRRVPMHLVRSFERRVPLYHEFREDYLVEVVRALQADGDVPVIIFSFGRAQCFDWARLLKSCARFTSKEEQEEIQRIADFELSDRGLGPELKPLLLHGIGIHHAGVLPKYKQLVERLTMERLLKFVVSTETIAAGINLPAKRVVFPSIRKYVKKRARILRPDEYHQMAGRAGRPQFDTEGIAITLAPDEVVQEFRKEIKSRKKSGLMVDEARIKKASYARAKTEAAKRQDVTWDPEIHAKLVEGQPAALTSQTRVTAEQILAIGLPDLAAVALPGQALVAEETARRAAEAAAEARARGEDALDDDDDDSDGGPEPAPEPAAAAPSDTASQAEAPEPERDLPAYMNLNVATVIDHLLLPEHLKREAHKQLAMVTRNLQALGVLDEHGQQVKGEIIGKFRGIDGPFVWYVVMNHDLGYEEARELVELLVDHDAIHRELSKKDREARRQWILAKLRELRQESPLATWDDAEEAYLREHPPVLSRAEQIHQEFTALVPHPELHGGKVQKNIWATMEDAGQGFWDFVEAHELAREEGSLFTYLARVMKAAKMLSEVTGIDHFTLLDERVRHELGKIDRRVLLQS